MKLNRVLLVAACLGGLCVADSSQRPTDVELLKAKLDELLIVEFEERGGVIVTHKLIMGEVEIVIEDLNQDRQPDRWSLFVKGNLVCERKRWMAVGPPIYGALYGDTIEENLLFAPDTHVREEEAEKYRRMMKEAGGEGDPK